MVRDKAITTYIRIYKRNTHTVTAKSSCMCKTDKTPSTAKTSLTRCRRQAPMPGESATERQQNDKG